MQQCVEYSTAIVVVVVVVVVVVTVVVVVAVVGFQLRGLVVRRGSK